MKQETKVIILVVLIVLLGIVAYVVIFRSKVPEVAALLPGATTTTAPAKLKADLPTQADVTLMKQWLADRDRPASKTQVTFGLASLAKPKASGDSAAAPTSIEPLRLDGILRLGRTAKAIIGGESYGEGQAVRFTPYTVVSITPRGVKLRSENGQELVLVLQE